MAIHPARQPNWLTTAVIASGAMPTPIGTPIAPSATARPRLRTNHFASVTLTMRLPISAAPAANITPRSAIHCQSSVTSLVRNSEVPRIVTPVTMNARPPKRSTYAPMKKPTKATRYWPIVCA